MDVPMTSGVPGVDSRKLSVLTGVSRTEATAEAVATGLPREDVLEICPTVLALSRADQQSPMGLARICEIRAEIKAGRFLTPERLEGLVDRLLDILG